MKLSTNKKKIIVLCTMVVLLVVAGTLNLVLNDSLLNPDDGSGAQPTFFQMQRTEREQIRATELAMLDAVIASEDASAEAKQQAEEMKLELTRQIESEFLIETEIKSKGFTDAFVQMGDKQINVFVEDAELIAEEVAQILGIITGKTDYKPNQVIVSQQ